MVVYENINCICFSVACNMSQLIIPNIYFNILKQSQRTWQLLLSCRLVDESALVLQLNQLLWACNKHEWKISILWANFCRLLRSLLSSDGGNFPVPIQRLRQERKILLLCIDDTCSFWQRVCICSLWEQRSAGIIVTHWFLYLWMPTSEMSHQCSTLFLQPWNLSASLKPAALIINFWIRLFSNQRMEPHSKIFF